MFCSVLNNTKFPSGDNFRCLVKLLEMRLDTILFRSGFAPTLRASRQLVTHGHICVNDGRVNIPSYQCKPGDSFVVKNKKVIVKAKRNNTL